MNTRLAVALGAGLLVASAHAERVAHGLIVQLKNAPAHHELREQPHAAQAAQAERWQRVLVEAGLGAQPNLKPTSRAAQLLRFERPLAAEQAERRAAKLRQRPDVEWVVPNERERRLQASPQPNDPLFAGFSQQWWLQPVSGSNANTIEMRLRGVAGFQTAWVLTTGDPAARVAVLDTGRTDHPDLAGRWVGGYDFVSELPFANDGDGRDANPSDPGDWVSADDRSADPVNFSSCEIEDSNWHGTIIAGLVAANTNNGAGVAATQWSGQVVPVRVAGKCGASVADIVDGMRWAAGLPVAGAPINPNPARIINISFGGSAACNAAYQSAIDEIRAHNGGVVVAAAGNEFGTPTRPASCERVIGVGALNRDGFKANYSNFGAKLVVSTVGGDDHQGAWRSLADSGLLTVINQGSRGPGSHGYANVYGTSFSAPLVAGALSLMLAANPALSADQLITGIRASARPHVTSPKIAACSADNPGRCVCTTATCGAGILDATEAVRYAIEAGAGRAYQAPNWPLVVIDHAELDAALAVSAQDRGTPIVQPPPPPADDGGGGAVGLGWLAALGLAAAALSAGRRKR